VITILTIIGHLLSCTIIAYAFARLRAPGRDALFIVMLATMMLPYPVTMVPLYVLFQRLGWINTICRWWRPPFWAAPSTSSCCANSSKRSPRLRRRRVHGRRQSAADPLSHHVAAGAPALATVAIFSFQATWNDFLAPLIYLQKPELYTVTLGLQFFRSTYTTNWAYLMAASLVTTLPVIVVFFLAQRYFIEGITLTGVKG
jgi:multiple sugar transport system permease protein